MQRLRGVVRGLSAAGGVAGSIALGGERHKSFPSSVYCDDVASLSGQRSIRPSRSIITVGVQKDRPGLLSEAAELLKRHHLDIRDAHITTEDGGSQAWHIYSVQDKVTGRGVDEGKLEEIRASLEKLGEVECTAKSWPLYTQSDVAAHSTFETGIWVSYKDGVYDITKFIANHPGGSEKLMLAAGKSIDPFWRIYQMHESRGNAPKQLELMRIGDLADPDPAPLASSECPYAKDPERHPGMILHNGKPCNAELPAELMMDSWLTPTPVWFIRHHHPVPVINNDEYRLVIGGEGTKPVSLSLDDLRTRFVKREVVSTIQCGGNRRSELDQVCKTAGIPWGFGAISTAKWGGVYLREVLMHCAGLSLEGVESTGSAAHIVVQGLDSMQASIPVEKALNPHGDVLLAYEMNGEPLNREHGAPIRLVVPGVVGVRNVKWVTEVTVSKEEAKGQWQRGMLYKGFSPMVHDLTGVDVEKIPSVQEMPVQSVIVSPKPGTVIRDDEIEMRGFAWSGGGRGIVRVDISLDKGQTWIAAELQQGSDQKPFRAWAWTFWEASVPVPEAYRGKEFTVLCRATDSSCNTQPEQPQHIWNLRGLNCNCWHRVLVKHDASE
mmetsp:Transcript_63410/g.138073  ORF Transcript_63410/g.138073 Transcript_63410/m.138073 type:complete len:607 (+) Transcript_63410:65-1885(+)|eukprot:CAMPEP_0170594826 /NCGR_PEP_ID=MMETSP0224-20130122/14210_1 /TAXON_ID=285029 /ORGANISM="Togula jolla, Strain CCCM 725" /LENGTH=606 /DNA_ID=CAMNT_0010918915 /DNA_START=52 /DNA_END=1872 /DNA_ORIENTATION=+